MLSKLRKKPIELKGGRVRCERVSGYQKTNQIGRSCVERLGGKRGKGARALDIRVKLHNDIRSHGSEMKNKDLTNLENG
jgi:hypothetical protein